MELREESGWQVIFPDFRESIYAESDFLSEPSKIKWQFMYNICMWYYWDCISFN